MSGALHFLLAGMVLGFAIAAPVGPIGLLCIRRSLQHGRGAGFITGMGAAVADTIYGAIAGFGLTGIANFLAAQRHLLGLAGSALLVVIGIQLLRTRAAPDHEAVAPARIHSAFLGALFLTLTNPMTIIAFTAAFTGLRLVTAHDHVAAAILVAGVFLGSAAWWLLLSSIAARFRERFDERWMLNVNRGAGAIILACGAFALVDLAR